MGLVASGVVCIAGAALFDVDFVQHYISADGHVEPDNAAALQIVRLALGMFGACQIAAASILPRLQPAASRLFQSRRRAQWAIFAFPLLILMLGVIYKTINGLDDRVYWILAREDGPVEWATAIVFLLSGCVFARVSYLLYRHSSFRFCLYFMALAIFCFFVGLEEISYGQRVFGFETPAELEKLNVQNETNIHNISSLSYVFFYHGPLAIGLFGILGCVLPLLGHLFGYRLIFLLILMVPPWYLSTWYLPYALFALYQYAFVGSLPLIEWQDSEVLEALVAIGFFGFAWHVRSRLVCSATSASRAGGRHPAGRL